MNEEYIINKKLFYNLKTYKYTGEEYLTLNSKIGIYEVYNGYFHGNIRPIDIEDSSGCLFVSESFFDECYLEEVSGIIIECPNNEFDVTIKKCCVYNCGKDTVKFANIKCSGDSFAFLKDLSITLSQGMQTRESFNVEAFHTAKLIGHNESHTEAFRHAGPHLISKGNQLKYLTLTKCRSREGIFIFLDNTIDDNTASYLIVTNNTVISSFGSFACVYSNNGLYIKESYVINNPFSYSINNAIGTSLRALNCVCDNVTSSAVIKTSFPEPQMRHLSLGKCIAENPLIDCRHSRLSHTKTKMLGCIPFLLIIEGVKL